MNFIKGILSQYGGQSRSVYVLFFGRLITSMGALIWPMMALILSSKLGYSQIRTSYIMIVIGLIFLPATWIGGKLADKFDRKRQIILMDSVSVVFFFLCAMTEPGMMLIVFLAIAGWFANMEGPVFESLIIDVTRPEEREVAYSLIYLARNLGVAVASIVSGMLFNNYLSVAFMLDGATTLISTILIVTMVTYVKAADLDASQSNAYEEGVDRDEKTFNVLMDRRSVFVQAIIFFLTGFIYEQYLFALPLYMAHVFPGQGALYYGYISSFNAVVVILLTPIITTATDRYSELPKVMAGIGLFSVSYLMIIGSPILPVFFMFMLFFTVGEILNMLGTSPFVSRRIPETHRGRVNSWIFIGFFLGSIAGKGVIGAVLEYLNYTVAFGVLAVIGGLTVLLTVYNYRVDRRRFPKLYERYEVAEERE